MHLSSEAIDRLQFAVLARPNSETSQSSSGGEISCCEARVGRALSEHSDSSAVSSGGRFLDEAVRRATRLRLSVGEEIRRARLSAGLSQSVVGRSAHVSQSVVSDIESGKVRSVSLETLVVVADAVGLDLTCRAYPGRRPTRDAAHARKLHDFLRHVAPPLRYRLELPLPQRDGVVERRAWDCMLFAPDGMTGVELEMRLYDVQDQTRRVKLKWRDAGVDRLLLLLNDSVAVREAVRENSGYFAELPRLKTSTVLRQLERGMRPESGYMLI